MRPLMFSAVLIVLGLAAVPARAQSTSASTPCSDDLPRPQHRRRQRPIPRRSPPAQPTPRRPNHRLQVSDQAESVLATR